MPDFDQTRNLGHFGHFRQVPPTLPDLLDLSLHSRSLQVFAGLCRSLPVFSGLRRRSQVFRVLRRSLWTWPVSAGLHWSPPALLAFPSQCSAILLRFSRCSMEFYCAWYSVPALAGSCRASLPYASSRRPLPIFLDFLRFSGAFTGIRPCNPYFNQLCACSCAVYSLLYSGFCQCSTLR